MQQQRQEQQQKRMRFAHGKDDTPSLPGLSFRPTRKRTLTH
jgi:hypothetical protein